MTITVITPTVKHAKTSCPNVIAMDRSNLRSLARLFGEKAEGKVRLLLPDRDIEDPWYTDDFETCCRDIAESLRALLAELER